MTLESPSEENVQPQEIDATTPTETDEALVDRLRSGHQQVLGQMKKRILGQDEVLEQVLLSLLVGGNSILTGVPGLAKTLIVQTVSEVLDLDFSRIQFTPDLMPSDITGTDIIQDDHSTGQRSMVFMKGPVFANIVLADEINRTPPKTQAALLEAMQEHRVTIQGTTYQLEEPFYVFATQNPIELEGTYPLPEAQLDRFMFDIVIDYLSEDLEVEVVRSTTSGATQQFEVVITAADLLAFQDLIRRVPVSDAVLRYAIKLVRASRPGDPTAPEFVRKWVDYGGSVRAAQYLVLGAKARALTQGRYHVGFDDLRWVAHPVLRHRILTNFHAESERVSSDNVIDHLLESIPTPRSEM